MTLFSVILPTHDRPEYLREAIESVLAQTVEDFELIVVDDGSEPPAAVPDDPRVSIVRLTPARGVAAARNAGLAKAQGRHVTFIDDDDLYDPHRLEMVRPVLDATQIVLCWFRYLGEVPDGRVLEGCAEPHLLSTTAPHLGATTVPRSLMQPFDDSYLGAEDVEWWVRMANVPVTTVPRVGYWLRRHGGQRINHGSAARILGSRRLLLEHREFFRRNRAAAAFRWRRIGIMAAQIGDVRGARRALMRSFFIRPDLRTVVAAVRVLRHGLG